MSELGLIIYLNDKEIFNNWSQHFSIKSLNLNLDKFMISDENDFSEEINDIWYNYYRFFDYFLIFVSKRKLNLDNLLDNVKICLKNYDNNNSLNDLNKSINDLFKDIESLNETKLNLDDIKNSLDEGIKKLNDRENLNDLLKGSNEILESSEKFKIKSLDIERRMKWRSRKIKIYTTISIVIFLIIFYLVLKI